MKFRALAPEELPIVMVLAAAPVPMFIAWETASLPIPIAPPEELICRAPVASRSIVPEAIAADVKPVAFIAPEVAVRFKAPVVMVKPFEAVKSPAEVIVPVPVEEILPEVVMLSPDVEGERVVPVLDQ